ncbi:MAG: hypothetical protein ABSG01_03680 [Anaerolineales bacterium]|jgi:hypothetical protein
MTEILKNIHLSFIWFHPVVDHWRKYMKLPPAVSFMASSTDLAQKIYLKTCITIQDNLTLPWPWIDKDEKNNKFYQNHFWQEHLESTNYWELEAKVYERYLVPLREDPDCQLSAEGFTGEIASEVFYFPFGVAFVLSAIYHSSSGSSFPQAITLFQKLRHEAEWTLAWDKINSSKPLKLDLLGQNVLGLLVERILGTGAAANLKPVKPFSLFTVVQGEYDPPQVEKDGGDIHHYLHAMTEWSITWMSDALPDLAQASVKRPGRPASHIIYTGKNGLAIWFPGLFNPINDTQSYLSCYHRNQLFSALFVQSLSGFLCETAKVLAANRQPVLLERECAESAAKLIGRIYGGEQDTYRSRCARKTIDQSGWIKDINLVRKTFHMDDLH